MAKGSVSRGEQFAGVDAQAMRVKYSAAAETSRLLQLVTDEAH
jgi:hypothetical protein